MKTFLLILVFLLLPALGETGVIFQDNFDAQADWNSDGTYPTGWSAATSYGSFTWNSILHYSGEINSGGCRGGSGKCFKQWRLRLPVMNVQYVGAEASGGIKIINHATYTLGLYAPINTLQESIDIRFTAAYDTIGELCSYIDGKADWTCTVESGTSGLESFFLNDTEDVVNDAKTGPLQVGWSWGSDDAYWGYFDYYLTEQQWSNYGRELYVRFYVNYGNDFARPGISGTIKGGRALINSVYNPPTSVFTLYFDLAKWGTTLNNSALGWSSQVAAFYSTHGVGELGLTDGSWHCIEMYSKLNSTGTADGRLKLWVDNVLEIDSGDYNLGANTDHKIHTPPTPSLGNVTRGYWSTANGSNWFAIKFDDYVISTERIGCLGGTHSGVSIYGGSIR